MLYRFSTTKKLLMLLIWIILILSIQNLSNGQFSFAQDSCNPPVNYNGCPPELNPNLNPELHNFNSYQDDQGLHYFNYKEISGEGHPLDEKLPDLSQIFSSPAEISGLYKIDKIDGVDYDLSWRGANAVGFTPPNGTAVRVPPSGYNIDGKGRQATILFASDNSITINYGNQGEFQNGYTVTFKDISVNPEILNLFQQANQNGQLVAVDALQSLGITNGETLVMIRDSGALLDARWSEWYLNGNYDLSILPPELIDILPQQPKPNINKCNVDGDKPDDGTFRPKPCHNCNLKVNKPITTCAQQPIITKKTTYTCGELNSCEDDANIYLTKKDWNITFKLNTKDTKVPFVSYHDINNQKGSNRSTNLNNYQADYLTGTALYDGQDYDMTKNKDVNDFMWNMGVFRKLAPAEIQDKLKIRMILNNYNYKVKNNLTIQSWRESDGSVLHYKNGRGKLPPDRKDFTINGKFDSQSYYANLKQWRLTNWGKYWSHIPMFTREDAPGKVILTVEHTPGELTPSKQDINKKINQSTSEYPLAIPHLSRYYQVTKELNAMLMPTIKKAQASNGIIQPTQLMQPNQCLSKFGTGRQTALGCIPTDPQGFISWIIEISISIGSGVTFLIFAGGGIILITASGDAQKIQQGKSLFIAGISGILIIIFSSFIYKIVAKDILQLPGFSQKNINQNNIVNISRSTQNNAIIAQSWKNGDSSNPLSYELIFTDENGRKKLSELKVYSNREDGGVHFQTYINGQQILTWKLTQGDQPFVITDEWLPDIFIKDNETIDINIGLEVSETGSILEKQCNISFVNGEIQSNCTIKPTQSSPPPNKCENNSNINNICIGDNPLPDNKPNDPVCCNTKTKLDVQSYKISVSRDKYQDMCSCDPITDPNCGSKEFDTEMTRQLEVRLKVPYLKEIYKDTIDNQKGFYNLFRPAEFDKFPVDDGLSGIDYEIVSGTAQITPHTELYWPYLGGIQRAKKCVSERMLVPRELQGNYNWCDFHSPVSYPNRNDANIPNTNASNPNDNDLDTCTEIDANMDNFFSSFSIRDSNPLSDDYINKISTYFASQYPKAKIDDLKDMLNTINNFAKNNNLNAHFLATLAIEESNLGLVDSYSAMMGCMDNNNMHDLASQLLCINKLDFIDSTTTRDFMLIYAEGYNNSGKFCIADNFPINIKGWYNDWQGIIERNNN